LTRFINFINSIINLLFQSSVTIRCKRNRKNGNEKNFSIYDYPLEYLKLEYPYEYENITRYKKYRLPY